MKGIFYQASDFFSILPRSKDGFKEYYGYGKKKKKTSKLLISSLDYDNNNSTIIHQHKEDESLVKYKKALLGNIDEKELAEKERKQ